MTGTNHVLTWRRVVNSNIENGTGNGTSVILNPSPISSGDLVGAGHGRERVIQQLSAPLTDNFINLIIMICFYNLHLFPWLA